MHPSITDLATSGACTGCGLCASIAPDAIDMRLSRAGFLRPALRQPTVAPDAASMALIGQSCPALVVERPADPAHDHVLWGPVRRSLTGHASDAEIWRQGSSGGVISALAWHLLNSGEVDAVAQIAVSHDDPLRNELQISTQRDAVLRAAGSRYAPAAPLAGLLQALDQHQRMAVVGKPCDVAAVRQLLRARPDLQARLPYLLSFMCAGTPSLNATHDLLKAMGSSKEQVVKFRYRGDGWPGMARAEQADGRSFEMDYNASWGGVLGKQLQQRCKICPDGTGEQADVTCADAWYGKDGYPDFTEREGRSLVLVRTAAGERLVDAATLAGNVKTEPLDIGEVARMQPYQVTRKRAVLGRTWAARLRTGHAPRYRGLGLVRASLQMNPLDWLRQAWGMWRRARREE